MKFIRIQCTGCLNSFRQPDFHTYHKTLPLPTKTTVAGMLGSALGISPECVNDSWLKNNRFQMGVVGRKGGMANDLWQIRKYSTSQIKAYEKGKDQQPYKTAVIVRELLYNMSYVLYLAFKENSDYEIILDKLIHPEWAISLGREDELIRIESMDIVQIDKRSDIVYHNTVLPIDLSMVKYNVQIDTSISYRNNLLNEAPQIVKVPISFLYDEKTQKREAVEYGMFSFIGNLPISIEEDFGFFDRELNNSFQIF